ncbi:Vacuolar protein sorting-associated protein 53 [Tieghemiomyces parasiticus]|uniref:Vacuolar protein sorting-associated protein 53 n=1 Tax=Tieghemiomyces parasiticus TaxID=78921 RepID=A0A9W7ZU57_9FUNG|nr:Vacuolar protein sorting-associated protein 53 [Tieghemiomyces parasiticus]
MADSGGSPVEGDILDSESFRPIDCVNQLFPSEQALWQLDVVAENLRQRVRRTDARIQQVMWAQIDTEREGMQEVRRTQQAIRELNRRISAMRNRAELSEDTVLNITHDIKALDSAKRNLVAAITLLKRIQMLAVATDQLRHILGNRAYREASHLLLAVQELRAYFTNYQRLPEVAKLVRDVDTLQRNLAQGIRQDFESSFNGAGAFTGDKERLKDACEILDLLASPERMHVVAHYCSTQLQPYTIIFKANDEVASLDNVSRRYAWLRRVLRTHDEEYATMFPADWYVDRHLCQRFAELTRRQLTAVMTAEGADLDVVELLKALQLTLAFERQLQRRFPPTPISKQSDPSAVGSPPVGPDQPSTAAITAPSALAGPPTFERCISEAFEPYLHRYVESEGQRVAELIETFKARPLHAEDDSELSVLSSSTDLLFLYREALTRCAGFSTGKPLLDLTHVFARGLTTYTSEILLGKLPKLYTVDERRPMSHDELIQVCLIINTADYCNTSAAQLERKLAATIQPDLRDAVQFDAQRDALFGAIHASIKSLVRGVESCCESAFSAMLRIPWATLDAVGDQSEYVTVAMATLRLSVGVIRRSLTNGRYVRTFCDKFVEAFTSKFLSTLQKCRQVSEVGAEQMLLDIQAIKTVLLELPHMGLDQPPPPPTTFVKLVGRGVGRIEAILKAILAPPEPRSAMVDNFLLLFPDATLGGFQVVLDLKGLKKAEQATLVELFKQRVSPAARQNTHRSLSLTSSHLPVVMPGPTPAVVANPSTLARIGEETSADRAFDSHGSDSTSHPSRPTTPRLGPSASPLPSTPVDPGRTQSPDLAGENGSWTPGSARASQRINHNLRRFMSGMSIRKGNGEGKSF